MRFFSKLLNTQDAIFIQGKNDFTLEIIDESKHQAHLKKLCGGYSKSGNHHEETAQLHYGKKQSTDKNPIRVVMKKKTVGYLSAEDAKRYRKRLKRLSEEGIVTECNAKIFGGTKLGLFERSSFEVWLDLSIEDFVIERVESISIEEVEKEEFQEEAPKKNVLPQTETEEKVTPKEPKPISLPTDL